MRQLSGLDAMHVLEERPAQHMHTMKIVLLDPSASTVPVTYEDVRAWAGRRLAHIPPLRWRLVKIPMRLGRPVWVDAPNLDLDYHIRRLDIGLGGDRYDPGGPEALDAAISDLASVPLDRSKPLWQLTVVEGLEDGRVALVLKLHHAVADGAASVRILEDMFGTSEIPAPGERTAPLPAERMPSATERMLFAVRANLALTVGLPSVARRTFVALRAGRRRRRAGSTALTRPLSGPPTCFNLPLTANRIYVNVTVPLADLKSIKESLGGTVNDVYLAICGGALRRYLDEHGEVPENPLTATAPVSIRREDELNPYGNRTSYWYVSLATDLADPVARLAAVRDSTAAARSWARDDRDLFADWQDFYGIYHLISVTLLHLTERLARRPVFNAIVSNIRGPRHLSFHGADVVAVRSMGPLVGAQGVNLTAWSYGDDLSIGLHACREHVPDLRRLGDHIVDELAALKKAAMEEPPARAS
jgi:diacylglycerol O-acyltransferase / wax synthase